MTRIKLLVLAIMLSLPLLTMAANPNLAGDSTEVIIESGTINTINTVSNLSAGHVQTDAMATGYVGSQSVTVGTSVAVKIGTLPAGTKIVRITPAADINYGGSWVGTGTGYAVMTATSSPYDFKVATTTPEFYIRGNAASVAVLIEHVK